MSYDLPKCEHAGCQGHLGKFQDCQSEALYEMSMDGADREFGDTDFDGYFSLISLTEDTVHEFTDVAAQGIIVVPAGDYIVQGVSSGAIYTWRSENATTELDALEASYDEWLTADDDEESNDG